MFKKVTKLFLISSVVFGGSLATVNANNNDQNVSAKTKSYKKAKRVASSKLGRPYSFGAVGPNSFDCSGFTRYVYKKGVKKNMPHNAQGQFNKYKHVKTSKIKKGDLVFFGGSKNSISHVGFAISKNTMIDAQNSGVVKEPIYAPWWHLVAASRPANLK